MVEKLSQASLNCSKTTARVGAKRQRVLYMNAAEEPKFIAFVSNRRGVLSRKSAQGLTGLRCFGKSDLKLRVVCVVGQLTGVHQQFRKSMALHNLIGFFPLPSITGSSIMCGSYLAVSPQKCVRGKQH